MSGVCSCYSSAKDMLYDMPLSVVKLLAVKIKQILTSLWWLSYKCQTNQIVLSLWNNIYACCFNVFIIKYWHSGRYCVGSVIQNLIALVVDCLPPPAFPKRLHLWPTLHVVIPEKLCACEIIFCVKKQYMEESAKMHLTCKHYLSLMC